MYISFRVESQIDHQRVHTPQYAIGFIVQFTIVQQQSHRIIGRVQSIGKLFQIIRRFLYRFHGRLKR